MERITVDLISSKEFSIESKGYNKKEVDEFLDDICDEMERMEAEIKDLKQKTVSVRETPAAPAAPAVTPQDTNSFKEILEMAQKVKEETIRKAKEDAEAIRARAEAEATDRLDGLNDLRLLDAFGHIDGKGGQQGRDQGDQILRLTEDGFGQRRKLRQISYRG